MQPNLFDLQKSSLDKMTDYTDPSQRHHSFISEYLRKLEQDFKPKNLYSPIHYILNQPGKRIRFNLTVKACELFGGESEDAIHAALATEVFHNFTLIHDDVMDGATTRRNHPTVHTRWDLNTAILSGDAMLILAYEILLTRHSPQTHQILHHFTDAAKTVCEGQQMDLDFESLPIIQMDTYLEMVVKKTAALIAGGMLIGALTAGAAQDQAMLLHEFGINLGIAFQIRDDMLDCYGERQKVGKKRGGDILQGKKTILYIRTWFNLSEDEQAKFESLYRGNSEDKVDQVMRYFDQTDVKSYAIGQEQKYFDKALKALKKIQVPEARKLDLFDFANNLMGRDH